MAQTTRQSSLLVQQDWTKIYQTFTNADFTSYDFETLRNSMINYLKNYYPDTFNDFLESSEYLALIDMIAFLGQSLSFRTDLNARENFIDTAQRRDSILKLARMLSYNPGRATAASGLLKINSIKTTESVYDSNGINLSNQTVYWNDLTNDNWLEQFTVIFNASLVSSQQVGKPGNSQKINGVQTDEYSINLNNTALPVAPFSVNVQGNNVGFEAVSATTVGESYIYEDNPTKTGQFNLLYRNDNNGNGSNNTGFFIFFKQGSLRTTAFTINNAIPNNYVPITTNNITNSDAWLYSLDVNNNPVNKWTAVPALPGVNVIFNNLTEKNLYQINTLNNDQVNLVFGDGSFANIPQGSFRFYYRTGNGLTYTIGPDDLSSVTISFSYLNKNNAVETLTMVASLKYTVTNANSAPSLSSIKSLAPQQYYTQNRMITGEDYNIFPQTSFTSIQKIKAVNRTSSGVSLYLDAIDPTGSYSSTNIFGDDGIIAANTSISSSTFTFLTTNDIYTAIYNQVLPNLGSTEAVNYYYANYTRHDTPITTGANLTFVSVANTTSTCSGYLISSVDQSRQQVGVGVDGNLRYVNTGASLLFTAPPGHYFDSQHQLQAGDLPFTGDNSTSFYATVKTVVSSNDPYTPNLITLGTFVPNTAVLTDSTYSGKKTIMPAYKTSFTQPLIATLVAQIKSKVNFGLTYSQENQTWTNIDPAHINASTDWLIKFTYNQGSYTINYRALTYSFASAGQTHFFYDPTAKAYDSTTGLTVPDTIKILKVNNRPDSGQPLIKDSVWQIYNSVTEPDGYVNQTKILVTSPDRQMPGVPDNLDLYSIVAGTSANRPGLYFQYKHSSPSRSRIDPTPVNIIDMYILISSYTTNYINWLRDLTGNVPEPALPTSTDLEISYSTLENFKTVSDTIIYNPARFKPLFGNSDKVEPNLRARFQVVKNPAAGLTDNEVKSQVISAINNYFDFSNWDFGDTFYFSELAAYLHTKLAPNISSILIVPTDNNLVFGNYFQINSDPWEIITSAATVNDVDVVTAITAAGLNLGNNLVGTY